MAVFRIEKTRDYTVMSNYHLRDRLLSLKAKGLLSLMLSLPEDWDYTMKGLARICKDGIDSISGGIRELEAHGYLVRARVRNENGQLGSIEYTILERPKERKRTIITRPEQSYGRVPFAGLCRLFISVYVPGAGLPGARASAFPAPHGSEICPDRAAYSAPAIDTHKAQCRWPWPFPPANTQWHWIRLP